MSAAQMLAGPAAAAAAAAAALPCCLPVHQMTAGVLTLLRQELLVILLVTQLQ
jgi:hypothetical protein